MDRIEIKQTSQFKGEFYPTPDKSVSHRAVIFSSLAKGKSVIINFLRADDPLSTVKAFRELGVEIGDKGMDVILYGNGIHGLKEPHNVIDCGNSGTTIRLPTGGLSGNHSFPSLPVTNLYDRDPWQGLSVP